MCPYSRKRPGQSNDSSHTAEDWRFLHFHYCGDDAHRQVHTTRQGLLLTTLHTHTHSLHYCRQTQPVTLSYRIRDCESEIQKITQSQDVSKVYNALSFCMNELLYKQITTPDLYLVVPKKTIVLQALCNDHLQFRGLYSNWERSPYENWRQTDQHRLLDQRTRLHPPTTSQSVASVSGGSRSSIPPSTR